MSGTIYESDIERVRPGPEADNKTYLKNLFTSLDEVTALTDLYLTTVFNNTAAYKVTLNDLFEQIDTIQTLGFLLADGLTSKYTLWMHNIPGSEYEILTLRNLDPTDEFTIFELRAPGNGHDLETTFSMHNYSETLGEDWVRDVSFHNYAGDMKAVDVVSNFTNSTRGNWEWWSKAIDGGVAVDIRCMKLDGTTGWLYIKGNVMPLVNDAQNLGAPDVIWSNAYIGYGKFTACRASSFRFYNEGTAATVNGVSGTFTSADSKTITIQGGIVTGIV